MQEDKLVKSTRQVQTSQYLMGGRQYYPPESITVFTLGIRNKQKKSQKRTRQPPSPSMPWPTLLFTRYFYIQWLLRLSKQFPEGGRARTCIPISQMRKLSFQEFSQPDQISSWCPSHVSDHLTPDPRPLPSLIRQCAHHQAHTTAR